jgi:hypothetical protein
MSVIAPAAALDELVVPDEPVVPGVPPELELELQAAMRVAAANAANPVVKAVVARREAAGLRNDMEPPGGPGGLAGHVSGK